eukprot:3401585-Prymnesium_polylepis.1
MCSPLPSPLPSPRCPPRRLPRSGRGAGSRHNRLGLSATIRLPYRRDRPRRSRLCCLCARRRSPRQPRRRRGLCAVLA